VDVKRRIREHEHRRRLCKRGIEPWPMDHTVRPDGWCDTTTIVPPDTSDKITRKGANTRADSRTGPHLTIGIQRIIEGGKSYVQPNAKSGRRADTRPSGR
jgi:hypothetical protein